MSQVQPVPRNDLPVFPSAPLKGSDLKAAKIAVEIREEFRKAKNPAEGLKIAKRYLRANYTEVGQALKAVRAISHLYAISRTSIGGMLLELEEAWLALLRLGSPANPEHARVASMGAVCISNAKISVKTARSIFSLYGDNEELLFHAHSYLVASTREKSTEDQKAVAQRLAQLWENYPKDLVLLGRTDAKTSRDQLGLACAFHWRYLAHNKKFSYGLSKAEDVYLELLRDKTILGYVREQADKGLTVVRQRMAENAKKAG